MFTQAQKLILILTLLNFKDNLVSCGLSKCLKVPHHYKQLALYKNEVNVPSNLRTSIRISEDGEKTVVFEFEVPQKGYCFSEEQVCLTNQCPQDQNCQEFNNQSMWFVLPFHNYFRTYKVTSLANERDYDNNYTEYSWSPAYQCAVLFQEEEDDLCFDFDHALVLEDKESFVNDLYDFKSALIQPGCQLMQYVIGEWRSVGIEGMFEFSEEITQYYCHCEDSGGFELGVTTVFPQGYKGERITSVPWVWDGTDTDGMEAAATDTSWETNAVKFLSGDKRSVIIIKGVLINAMIIAVVDSLILGLYIWMEVEVESSWEQDEDF